MPVSCFHYSDEPCSCYDEGPAPVDCPCVICGKESVVQDEDGNDLCAPCNKEVSAEVKRLEAIIEAVDFVLARRAS